MTDRQATADKQRRQKSFLRGCLYFNNRRTSLDCLIRDISETARG